jgi:hypothetical protein
MSSSKKDSHKTGFSESLNTDRDRDVTVSVILLLSLHLSLVNFYVDYMSPFTSRLSYVIFFIGQDCVKFLTPQKACNSGKKALTID